MSTNKKTPINGATNTVDGLTTDHVVHSNCCETGATGNYTSSDSLIQRAPDIGRTRELVGRGQA